MVLTCYILPLDTLTGSSGTPKKRILNSDATEELGGSSGKLKLRAKSALCEHMGMREKMVEEAFLQKQSSLPLKFRRDQSRIYMSGRNKES